MELLIDLNSVSKVKDFVKVTQNFPYEMYLKSGKCTVDAKSIMGIFSLDLSSPLMFVLDIDGITAREAAGVMNAVKAFEVA